MEIGTQRKLENPRTKIHTPVYDQIILMRTYELNNARKVGIEILDIDAKLRREGEWPETKGKGEEVGNEDDKGLPLSTPIQRIMRIVARLRDQDRSFGTGLLDEMMGTEIRHDFGARKDLNMEFLLQLMTLFLIVNI